MVPKKLEKQLLHVPAFDSGEQNKMAIIKCVSLNLP